MCPDLALIRFIVQDEDQCLRSGKIITHCVSLSYLALIRFIVQDEDVFGDPNFLGQATYPVQCLRSGKIITHCVS